MILLYNNKRMTMKTELSESLDKLNKLTEDIDTSAFILHLNVETNGSEIREISSPSSWSLDIPEGVTYVHHIDWKLYSSIGTAYFTTLKEITFPTTLERIGMIFRTVQPQYEITLRFKGDINVLLSDIYETSLDPDSAYSWCGPYIDKIIKAKPKDKEERAKRLLCAIMNIPYTRAKFVFDVPLNIDNIGTTTTQL